MAHAYETIAHGGRRVTGTLAEDDAPVGIQEVNAGCAHAARRVPRRRQPGEDRPVLPPYIAETETTMLETVLQYGTAHDAAIGQFAAGKTGTTSNYGDAWFIGWDKKYTVAVWVGYPNSLVPMTTEYDGGPVLGGTFPALIWHNFVISAMQLEKAEAEQAALRRGSSGPTGAGGGQGTSAGEGATGTPSGTTAPLRRDGGGQVEQPAICAERRREPAVRRDGRRALRTRRRAVCARARRGTAGEQSGHRRARITDRRRQSGRLRRARGPGEDARRCGRPRRRSAMAARSRA